VRMNTGGGPADCLTTTRRLLAAAIEETQVMDRLLRVAQRQPAVGTDERTLVLTGDHGMIDLNQPSTDFETVGRNGR
jgi:GAF domain-containing protein